MRINSYRMGHIVAVGTTDLISHRYFVDGVYQCKKRKECYSTRFTLNNNRSGRATIFSSFNIIKKLGL
jgi:hypothetical protein